MKKLSLLGLIVISIFSVSCKKKHKCYVQDSKLNYIDTIPCNCNSSTIKELESTPYIVNDSTAYSIFCQKE